MSELKIAVIGAGWVAQIAHLPAWSKFKNIKILAIADVDEGKASKVAEKFNIPNVCTDIAEVLEKVPEIDAVDICTYTGSHFAIAQAALLAEKHVIVEKPIATTSKEAKRLVNIAKERNKKLLVAMNHRFRPDSMILKSFIQGNEIGKIFYARTGWLKPKPKDFDSQWQTSTQISGGGVFMDIGIHVLDLSWWLMGNPNPMSVSASIWKNGKTPAPNEAEDSAVVYLKFEDESSITVETGWTFNIEYDLINTNFFGTTGSAILNPLRIYKNLHGQVVNVTPAGKTNTKNLFKDSYSYELGHFIEVILTDKESYSKPEDAVKRLQIIEAIYESGRTGKEIKF